MAGLERYDIGVDGEAERDSDASQAHDGGVDSEEPHRSEGQQQDEWQRGEGHERTAPVEQEEQDHQHHHRDFFGQSSGECPLHSSVELLAIVDADELDPWRKPGA